MKEGSRRQTRQIDPIPYVPRAGETEDFDVRLTAEQLESLMDEQGDIRFEKVAEYLLPYFDGDGFFEWVAGRMRNYMKHIIATESHRPRYYKPEEDKVSSTTTSRASLVFNFVECSGDTQAF